MRPTAGRPPSSERVGSFGSPRESKRGRFLCYLFFLLCFVSLTHFGVLAFAWLAWEIRDVLCCGVWAREMGGEFPLLWVSYCTRLHGKTVTSLPPYPIPRLWVRSPKSASPSLDRPITMSETGAASMVRSQLTPAQLEPPLGGLRGTGGKSRLSGRVGKGMVW